MESWVQRQANLMVINVNKTKHFLSEFIAFNFDERFGIQVPKCYLVKRSEVNFDTQMEV